MADLRAARIDRDWTQHALAQAANVGYNQVSKAERGIAINRATLERIAKALDMCAADFPNVVVYNPLRDRAYPRRKK